MDNDINWVDILKIDIEGAEWGIFIELIENGSSLPFTQILVEVHTDGTSQVSDNPIEVYERFFNGLAKVGYRMFSAEPNVIDSNNFFEFSFIKVDERGYFVQH